MTIWYDSDNPYVFSAGKHFETPASLAVDPGNGNVQIQFPSRLGVWTTPVDAAYTISVFGIYQVPRANMFETRILATGTAQFSIQKR